MDILDFALGLIRAPWVTRLRDRTFQALIATAIGSIGAAVAVWNTREVPVHDKINLTFAAIGAVSAVVVAFTASEKSKDAKIASAAIEALGEEREGGKPKSSKEIGLGLLQDLADKQLLKLQEKAVLEQEVEADADN